MLMFISLIYNIYANNIDSRRAGYKLRSAVSSGTRLIWLLHSVHVKDTISIERYDIVKDTISMKDTKFIDIKGITYWHLGNIFHEKCVETEVRNVKGSACQYKNNKLQQNSTT